MNFLNPKHWQEPKGYNNGVLAEGRQLFIAGQIGWDANCKIVSDDFVAQMRQALVNIVAVLAEADATPSNLVRLTWFIKDKQEYLSNLKEVGKVYREVIGKHYPAMSLLVVQDLLEEGAKVEIEATAVIP